MLKFISPKEEVIAFENPISEVDEKASPIKEILRKGDFSSFYFVNGEEEDKIQLSETFQLQVNTKNIGAFHFIFKLEGFKKEEIIKQVATLKEINVIDYDSASYKVNSLINIVKEYNPLFMVFREFEDSRFYSDLLYQIIGSSFPAFLILNKEEEIFREYDIGAAGEVSTTPKTEKKEKEKGKTHKPHKLSNINWKALWKEVNNNKFHLLLILISTLLLEVAIPLAILHIYAKNALYIFLFICSVIGVGMNAYSYYDYFKRKTIDHPIFFFSVLSNLIGVGAGIGVFAIFYNISTKAEGTPGVGSLILIGLLVSLIVCGATIALIYFIRKNAKPKKK